MTYPAGTVPDGDYIYSGDGGFAAYAATTQEQWTTAITDELSDAFDDSETGFADLLSDSSNGDTNAQAALDLIDDVAKAIHNGYNGSGGTGTAAQVQAVIEDIVTRLEALEP